MNLKRLKLELFYLRKASSQNHQEWRYIKNKFFFANKIKKLNKEIEKPLTHDNLSIHTIFGHQHLTMALWSLGSYYAVSKCIGKLYLHSDGTLTDKDKSILNFLFPSAEMVDPRDVLIKYSDNYDQRPRIKEFRVKYKKNFFLTKLVDPLMVSNKDFRLFFDVDVLWFKNSDIIQEEILSKNPHSLMTVGILSANSIENSVYFKDGSKIPRELMAYNGGVMLYHRKNFPIDKLAEYLYSVDMSRPESQHWVEQSGYAVNMENLIELPKNKYVIKGKVTSEVVARHYTSPRRVEFYTEGLPLLRDLILN